MGLHARPPQARTRLSSRRGNRRRVCRLSLVAGILCRIPLPTPATAQGVAQSTDMQAVFQAFGQAMIPKIIKRAMYRRLDTVLVAPTVVPVDPTTKTATIQFSNPSATDTLKADVDVEYAAPRPDTPPSATAPSGQDPAGVDSSHSLATWMTDLPAHLLLMPGETRTVVVHLAVPPHLRTGEYSAHLVVTTVLLTDASPGTLNVKGKDWAMAPHIENVPTDTPPTVALVVYHVRR